MGLSLRVLGLEELQLAATQRNVLNSPRYTSLSQLLCAFHCQASFLETIHWVGWIFVFFFPLLCRVRIDFLSFGTGMTVVHVSPRYFSERRVRCPLGIGVNY